MLIAYPTTGEQDAATDALVNRLNDTGAAAVRADRLRDRAERGQRQLHQPGRQPAAVAHRSGRRAVDGAAARGVPFGGHRGQGRADEPAVRLRRLRGADRGNAVGLARARARLPGEDARHHLGADLLVRDPVRPVDGLRGVPAVEDPRGVRPVRRQRARRRARAGRHRAGDLGRRRDHGGGIPVLRAHPGCLGQADRAGAGRRRTGRRDGRTAGAGPGGDGTARAGQLVAPGLAGRGCCRPGGRTLSARTSLRPIRPKSADGRTGRCLAGLPGG